MLTTAEIVRLILCIAIAISLANCLGCVESHPTGDQLFEQAEQARIEGNQEKALQLFKDVVAIDPSNAIAWVRIGSYATAAGTKSAALDAFAKALEIDPNLALAYHNRAVLYISHEEWDSAIADASKAIELNPRRALSYIQRGYALHSLGRDQEALIDMDTAIRLEQSDVQAYRTRGAVKIALANWAGAVADYTSAIQLSNSPAGSYFERSWAHYNLGQIELAIDDAKQAIRLEPNHSLDHDTIALYYLSQGTRRDPDLALTHARRACELDGRRDWRFLCRLANALIEVGKLEEAKATIEEALALAPDHPKELCELNAVVNHRIQQSVGSDSSEVNSEASESPAATLWRQLRDVMKTR